MELLKAIRPQLLQMYFVFRGAVDVVSEDGSQVFDTLKAGASCGEVALLFSCPRIASIRLDLTLKDHAFCQILGQHQTLVLE